MIIIPGTLICSNANITNLTNVQVTDLSGLVGQIQVDIVQLQNRVNNFNTALANKADLDAFTELRSDFDNIVGDP
jgi:heterodisulfide reductase subunit A-like polyferredoxin